MLAGTMTFNCRSKMAAAAIAALLSGAVSAQADDAKDTISTMLEFGLVGTWAVDCGEPPSKRNQYLRYVVDSPIGPHITNNSGAGEYVGTLIVSATRLAPDRIGFATTASDDQQRLGASEVIKTPQGKIKSIEAVITAHGIAKEIIRDGHWLGDGRPTVEMERCDALPQGPDARYQGLDIEEQKVKIPVARDVRSCENKERTLI
ncbi:hypothetical protein [Oleomonas cavernae]|uniref:hypothetical protein n=1 Tax=Oleomonas cavernae TaxID=2320859 RepID=UPI0013145C8E|nr:hypothetical protein [Oleomonas cavernae]